jgi:hypothetical protein
MARKVTVGRKVETSSVVIPIIHEASFPGLDIVSQFLWSISLFICFSSVCVLMHLDVFILRMQSVQYSTVHEFRILCFQNSFYTKVVL